MELTRAMRGLMIRGLDELMKEELTQAQIWAFDPEVDECIAIFKSNCLDATYAINNFATERVEKQLEQVRTAKNELRSAVLTCHEEVTRRGY